MADMCVSIPFIGDSPSELYKEIYNYTGKNRKLTNLVYATAKQSWFTKEFSPSDFNSQEELNPEKVIEKLHLAEYIDIEPLIKNTERRLHAVDSTGAAVEYDNVAEIFDRVQEVNADETSKVIAKIVNKGGKYIISVQLKDDTNFALYELYKSSAEQLYLVLNTLSEAGFNTMDLSDRALIALNALNALNFPVLLSKLLKITNPTYLSENQVQLLLNLMADNPKVERLYDKFGRDTVKAVKYLLTDKKAIPEELEDLEPKFTKATRDMMTLLREEIIRKATTINASDLTSKLNAIYKGNTIELHEGIKKTLKNLYKEWHLDKDTIYAQAKEIESLLDATEQIISRLHNNMQFLKSKGYITTEETKEFQKQLEQLLKKVEHKEYLKSILGFLEDVTEELDTLSNIDVSLVDEDSYNDIAFKLLYAKLVINNYSPIIEALIKIDSLKLAEDLEVSDLETIKKLAKSIKSQLDIIEKGTIAEDGKKIPGLKDRIYTLVYKYFKERWGDDKKKFYQVDEKTGKEKTVLGSFEMSLSDALNGTNVELNICDRLLFSLTEVSDPVLATFGKSIKDLHEIRDEKLRDTMLLIRRTTDALYKSGSNSEFMLETLSDGEVKIISEIDYDTYEKDKNAYIQDLQSRGIKGDLFRIKLQKWEDDNTEEYTVPGLTLLSEITGEENHPVVVMAPKAKYRKAMPSMTDALRTYYQTMMSIKASMEYNLQRHGVTVSLFSPVQITSEISDAIAEASPSEAFKLIKDNVIDKISIREDDINYGNKEVLINSEGEELKQLPVHYIQRLGDQKRVNKDFSKSLLAYSAMATNYSVMAEHINSLELIKEFLLERTITQKRGNSPLVGSMIVGNKRELTPVTKKTRETSTGKWLEGIMDTKVYGIRHQPTGNIGGTNINVDKATDVAVSYSSITGLSANVPGAIANALVGKLQMIIEAGGGEFFDFKSYHQGSLKYYALLPELWQELYSNNKKSMLHLLMLKFDVLDDFYDSIRETGFYKNGLNKIIGNSSLFFLYGLGEHLLHAQGMLACLYHTKVIDTKTNKKVSLIEVFDKEIKDNNGKLIVKEGYKTLDGKEITEDFILRQKNAIAYVNRSMQGAFGADEKGLIHQYAWGRLIMNFRQWMPAHYARRFNKLHWDATLGDFREGYYVTCAKFVYDCAKLIKKRQFDLVTRYKSLNDVQKANLRRTLTETVLLIILTCLSRLNFGDDPKHRTKAEAMLKYEIKRMLMETSASDPFSILLKGEFFSNIYKTLNSPIAAIAPAQRFTTLFGIGDLITMKTIQGGPHEGDYVYFRNVERAIPFYDLVYKWWNIDTDDSMFKVFNSTR